MPPPPKRALRSPRRVFFKQRKNCFYKAVAWVLGLLITQLPSLTLESLIFSICLYWITGAPPAGACLLAWDIWTGYTMSCRPPAEKGPNGPKCPV